MTQQYNFNKATKVLWAIFGPVILVGGKQAHNSGNLEWFVFFLVGVPLWIFINIIIWSLKITLTKDCFQISQKFKKREQYNWDQIEEIKDDYFLIFHLYWLLTPDREMKLFGWKGLTFDNQSTSRYALLLANAISHVKPQTVVSESILRHLNMPKTDVGKYYMQNQWVESIKVNSYWKEKI